MEQEKMLVRKCAICDCNRGEVLHNMEFAVFDNCNIPNSYDIVSCERCDFIFADVNAPQSIYNHYYMETTNFDAVSGTNSNDNWMNTIFKCISRFISKTDSIIDIGCGSGGVLRSLKNDGYTDLEGLDISEEIKSSLEKYEIPTIAANFFDYNFRGKKYDTVIATEIFEHIKELSHFTGKLKSIIKPGGIVFITVPDTSKYYQVEEKPFFSISIEHVNHFDMYSLTNLLENNGLSYLYIERCNRSHQGVDYPVMAAFKYEKPARTNIVKAFYSDNFMRFIQSSQKSLEKEILKQYAEAGIPTAV